MPRRLMTVEEVKERVKGIRESKGDYEHAHASEGELYKDVLKAIADNRVAGLATAILLAKEALKASRIKFPRHTA